MNVGSHSRVLPGDVPVGRGIRQSAPPWHPEYIDAARRIDSQRHAWLLHPCGVLVALALIVLIKDAIDVGNLMLLGAAVLCAAILYPGLVGLERYLDWRLVRAEDRRRPGFAAFYRAWRESQPERMRMI